MILNNEYISDMKIIRGDEYIPNKREKVSWSLGAGKLCDIYGTYDFDEKPD